MRALVVLVAVLGCKARESSPAPPPRKPIDAALAAIDAPLDAAEVAPVVIPETAPAQRMWVPRIDDAKTFEAYSKEIGNERFAKFVIDLQTDAIYYFDVTVYPVHKDFIFGALYKKPKTKEAVRIFDRNYGANKTDFMMCYLVHHLSQDVWTLAFWDGDLAPPGRKGECSRCSSWTTVPPSEARCGTFFASSCPGCSSWRRQTDEKPWSRSARPRPTLPSSIYSSARKAAWT